MAEDYTATERKVFEIAKRKGGVAATIPYALHAAGYGEKGARQILAAIAKERHAMMPSNNRPSLPTFLTNFVRAGLDGYRKAGKTIRR